MISSRGIVMTILTDGTTASDTMSVDTVDMRVTTFTTIGALKVGSSTVTLTDMAVVGKVHLKKGDDFKLKFDIPIF